jgi:hypothetical protein
MQAVKGKKKKKQAQQLTLDSVFKTSETPKEFSREAVLMIVAKHIVCDDVCLSSDSAVFKLLID